MDEHVPSAIQLPTALVNGGNVLNITCLLFVFPAITTASAPCPTAVIVPLRSMNVATIFAITGML